MHENLLPALERFSVLVSRLRGLSKFQEPNTRLGLSTCELENILDTTNCLQLLAHHILIAAGSEFRQFLAFSAWLRKEIEIQSTDNSSSMDESNEKEPEIDYASTLGYIQGGMMNSRLNKYFMTEVPADKKSQWNLAAKGRSLYDLYKDELQDRRDEVSAEKNLPGLDTLIAHLDSQCVSVFAGIAETQRRNVRFGSLVSLGQGIPACMDMRMLAEVRYNFDGNIFWEKKIKITSMLKKRMYLFYMWHWGLDMSKIMVGFLQYLEGLPLTRNQFKSPE